MKRNKQKHVYINELAFLHDQLIELYEKYRRSFFRIISNKQLQYLKDYVIEMTSFLPKHTKLIIRIHCVLQNITELPKCKTCNKPIAIKLNKYKRFNLYCNASCRQRDTEVYLKQNEKKLNKYGSINNAERAMLTKEKKYGVRGYNNPDKANRTKFRIYGEHMYSHRKYKTTSVEKYGVDNYMRSEDGKSKYKTRLSEKYGLGITNAFQLQQTRDKAKSTKKRLYGDENYNNQDKIRLTCIEKYGVEHVTQCPEFQRRRSLYYFDNHTFDSKPELAYYVWLTDKGIKFEYHNGTHFSYLFKSKTHVYFPDFYLLDNKLFVEIKGDHFFKDDGSMVCPFRMKMWTDDEYNDRCMLEEAKHQCMVKNGVRILRSSDYNEFIEYVNSKYGKEFFRKAKYENERS